MQATDLLREDTKLRSSKYLNNLIEQDHRGIKARIRPMLGFKNFSCAAITLAGVELLRRIGKGQFTLGRLRLKNQTAPAILEGCPRCINRCFFSLSLCHFKYLHQSRTERHNADPGRPSNDDN